MRYVSFFLLVFSLNSCATVLHSPYQKIYYASDTTGTFLQVLGEDYAPMEPIVVPRKRDTIAVKLYSDSTSKEFMLKAHVTPLILGNFIFNYLAPVGIVLDFLTDRRFEYPKYLTPSFDESGEFLKSDFTGYFELAHPRKPGSFAFHIGTPFVSQIYTQPYDHRHFSSGGVFGIELGAQYAVPNDNYYELSFMSVSDLYFNLGEVEDIVERQSAMDFSISRFHDDHRLKFGYGLHLARYTYERTLHGYSNYGFADRHLLQHTFAIGPVAFVDYPVSKYLQFGLSYRPTFFEVSPKPVWIYGHVVSANMSVVLY